MQLSELFSLHRDFRSLRLLCGNYSGAALLTRWTLDYAGCAYAPDTLVLALGFQLPRDEAQLCSRLRAGSFCAAGAVLVRAAAEYDPAALLQAVSADAPPVLSISLGAGGDETLRLIQAAFYSHTAYLNYLHTSFQSRAAGLLANNRCPSTLLTLLYDYLRIPVFLFSRQYALPARCCSGVDAQAAEAVWKQSADQLTDAPDSSRRVIEADRLYLFLPVLDSRFVVADLCAVYHKDRPPTETDLLLLRAALPQIAFLMQRSTLHHPFLYQQPLFFFHAALTDMFNGKPELLEKNAEHLGLVYHRPRLLLLLEAEPEDSFDNDACRNRIAVYLSSLSQKGHLFRHCGHLLFMTECAAPQRALEKFCVEVLPQLKRIAGTAMLPGLAIGCSSVFCSLQEMPEALAEADFSLHMGKKLHPEAMLYRFDDYMLYYLLSSIKDTPAISRIYSEVITTLQDYDQQNSTDLLETLLNLCQNNFSTSQTSTQMYLHRNSLYKRITRISEILDMNLDLPDNFITLHLAARLYRLLNEKESYEPS